MKLLPAVLVAASSTLFSAASFADNFNYNYLQLGAAFDKTEFKTGNHKPDFSGKGFNAQLQYSPFEGVYVKGVFSRRTVDQSKSVGITRYKLDGNTTNIGALAGVIFPVTDGIDLRAGFGIARSTDKYTSTGTIKGNSKQTVTKTDINKTGFYGETGLKFDLGNWGDLDLLYSRINKANYFSIGGNTPITENLGVEVGYSFSPKGPNRERFGSLNVGVRFYY
ncbi:outer membrane beta-barrel protein [Endozoicomonadaceae bacterium StTr2]